MFRRKDGRKDLEKVGNILSDAHLKLGLGVSWKRSIPNFKKESGLFFNFAAKGYLPDSKDYADGDEFSNFPETPILYNIL